MCSVSRSIAEYKFMHERQTGGKVNMEVAEVVQVDEFNYLESALERNGQCKGR